MNKKTKKKVKKNNKVKEDKNTKGTSLIGWGGYGCIFQPSTNCDGSISKNKNNKYPCNGYLFWSSNNRYASWSKDCVTKGRKRLDRH